MNLAQCIPPEWAQAEFRSGNPHWCEHGNLLHPPISRPLRGPAVTMRPAIAPFVAGSLKDDVLQALAAFPSDWFRLREITVRAQRGSSSVGPALLALEAQGCVERTKDSTTLWRITGRGLGAVPQVH